MQTSPGFRHVTKRKTAQIVFMTFCVMLLFNTSVTVRLSFCSSVSFLCTESIFLPLWPTVLQQWTSDVLFVSSIPEEPDGYNRMKHIQVKNVHQECKPADKPTMSCYLWSFSASTWALRLVFGALLLEQKFMKLVEIILRGLKTHDSFSRSKKKFFVICVI